MPENYGKHTAKTYYGNGSLRTEFSYAKEELVGNIRLFDSSGNLRLDKPLLDTSISSNYFSKSPDSADSVHVSILSREITPLMEDLLGKHGNKLHPRASGKVEYWIWINQSGHVEHAVCRRFERVRPAFIQGAIEEMEKWKFSPGLVGKGAVVRQQVKIDPGVQRTNILSFILGVTCIAILHYVTTSP
jgi:hypothetical protein